MIFSSRHELLRAAIECELPALGSTGEGRSYGQCGAKPGHYKKLDRNQQSAYDPGA